MLIMKVKTNHSKEEKNFPKHRASKILEQDSCAKAILFVKSEYFVHNWTIIATESDIAPTLQRILLFL